MIHRASSFRELLDFRFAGETNAACWQRRLPGDYAEVVRLLGPGDLGAEASAKAAGIVALEEDRLRSLKLSANGSLAVEQMLCDLRLLRDAGRDPVLNIVYGYEKDEDPLLISTDLSAIASATAEASANRGSFARDVFSWHVDSAPIESDTWLCTYYGSSSEALDPDDAILKVSDPAIRAQLLELYQATVPSDLSAIGCATAEALAKEGDAFTEWLAENHYDLHYSARPGATPYSFGQFNLWRIACENTCLPRHSSKATADAWPGSPVPPCVHRAPITGAPRLLLIS